MANGFLSNAIAEFKKYKSLAESAMAQLAPADLFQKPNEASNSIAIIVQHMSGNMLSRWTDFLSSDGEKPWRQRDAEFEEIIKDEQSLMEAWQTGWACLFNALDSLTEENLSQVIRIRGEEHTVTQAIIRQLAHYSSHVGQVVLLAKIYKGNSFQSLSIPRHASAAFNQQMFGKK